MQGKQGIRRMKCTASCIITFQTDTNKTVQRNHNYAHTYHSPESPENDLQYIMEWTEQE